MPLEWNGDALLNVIQDATNAGVTAAARVLATEMQNNLGSGGNAVPTRMRRKRKTKRGKKGSSYTVWVGASRPWQYPGVRTSDMSRSIAYTTAVSGKAAAGSTMLGDEPYPLILEFGSDKMAPRPWIWRSLFAAKKDMDQEFIEVSSAVLASSFQSGGEGSEA